MAQVRAVLAKADLLDGPANARDRFAWLRDGRHRKGGARVRVWALRANNHRLSSDECRMIAGCLSEIASAFVRSFGAFCAHAAEEGGAWEGSEALATEPEPWRADPPPFRLDEALDAKIARRLDKALAFVRAEKLADAPDLAALATLDRLAPSLDDERTRNLGVFALECMRRAHGGVWGMIGEHTFGVRLSSGVVVSFEVMFARFHAAPSEAAEMPFTLAELGATPVQV